MAQINIVKLSDALIEDRFDAEFHKFIYKNPLLIYKKIRDILKFVQYGISIEMNEENNGCKIYRMNEIENMFCSDVVSKFAIVSSKEVNKFRLKDKDVLFNRTNSFEFVGRTGIFRDFDREDYIFASYLVRVRPDESLILPEYLVAFLNSKYGIADIKRRARISINQSNVSAEELQRIDIPLLKMNIQRSIKDNFDAAFLKIKSALQIYKESESILLEELGFKNYDPKILINFESTLNEINSARRYDAEYYQPKYKEIINKLNKYPNGALEVKDVIKFNDKNFKPKGDIQYKYIELANISANGIINGHISEVGKSLPSRARRKIKDGELIVSSIEGSLSSCALINKEYDGALCSTGFHVLSSDKINSETLLVFFKSIIMQSLLKRGCSGTILTAIGRDELEKIKIPIIKDSIQKQIKNKINEAYKLREEAKTSLELAKKMVEEEIEK